MRSRLLQIPIFLCSLKVTLTSASPQLIGHRGVIRPLPEGQIYRDRETVEASEAAARFGLSIEYEEEIRHEQNRFESERNGVYPPRYRFYGGGRGRPLQQNEVFDFLDSRFIDVFPENEFNEFLDEVEIERATSPTRTFPGEGLPPGRHPGPTRPPNRLTDLSQPLELSDRAKNAIEGTVFDRPSPDFFNKNHGIIPTSVESPIRSVTPFVHIGDGGPSAVSGGSSPGLPAIHNQPVPASPVQLSSVPFTNIQPQVQDLPPPPPSNIFPGDIPDTFVNLGGQGSSFPTFPEPLPSIGGGRPFVNLGTGPAPLSHNSPGVGFDGFSAGPPVVRGSRSLSLSQGPHHSFALHHPSSF